MFNFMKKGVGGNSNSESREKSDRDEKERRKREKKLRKESKGGSVGGVSGSMSTEELLRLDEVRRSLKIRGRRKEKEKLPSGITADYSAEFFAQLDIDRSTLGRYDDENGINNTSGGSGGGSIELDRGNEEIITSVATIDNRRLIGSTTTANGCASTGTKTSTSYISLHTVVKSNAMTAIDPSETSIHSASMHNSKSRFLPPVPPKPPKRGILKGSRSNIANIHEEITIMPSDSRVLLMQNTIQNELLFGDGGQVISPVGGSNHHHHQQQNSHGTSFTSVESLRSDEGHCGSSGSIPGGSYAISPRLGTQSPLSNLHVMTSPSPSAESLTDTTNSSFATPPFSLSPIGESQGTERWSRVHTFEDIDLPLPPIKLVALPPPREFVIKRQKSPRNDFGFSLRKAICLDRSESLTSPNFRPVIFAEPGAGGGATGLLPGDRLLKVNGLPVGDLTRETIIEMIRNSGESVSVEVQPVSELVELSRRCMTNGCTSDESGDEVDRCAVKVNCSTLKRSASKRFKQQQSLRASIVPGTPQKPGSCLKPEIHRGCTGKAHACGTIKTKVVQVHCHAGAGSTIVPLSNVISNNNHHHNQQQQNNNHHHNDNNSSNVNHRKNSVSSETISDSGSENSSWNSNENPITIASVNGGGGGCINGMDIHHKKLQQQQQQHHQLYHPKKYSLKQHINSNISGCRGHEQMTASPLMIMKTLIKTKSMPPPHSPASTRRKKIIANDAMLLIPPSIDEIDRRSTASQQSTATSSSSMTTFNRRTRLYSDGDRGDSPPQNQHRSASSIASSSGSDANIKSNFQRNRSFRVTHNRNARSVVVQMSSSPINGGTGGGGSTSSSNTKPPWQSVFPKSKMVSTTPPSLLAMTSTNTSSSSSNNFRNTITSLSAVGGGGNMGSNINGLLPARNNSFNRNLRNSLRRKDSVDWNAIYERSLALRGYGASSGVYKMLDSSISKKSRLAKDNSKDDSSIDDPTSSSGTVSGENVWLVHRGGFCAAVRLPQQQAHIENHKVIVQLLHNGEELTVDEDDIEKSNPSSLDLVEDICQLKHLNEASVLHCLRQRYASNLIHTKAGPILMVVNPMAPLSLYSEKVVSMFRGCKTEDMPPHIYSLAQTAYRTMLETRRDQSLIFMGRSGSGKTTSFKHALYYLALAAGSYNKLLTAEKVNSVNTILEAFGNTKTSLNSNATRFTQILSLDFDQTGQIASASVQVLLPDRQRAGKRNPTEHSFHIMTRLLAGAEGLLQKELHLENISSEDNHPFVSLSQKLEERHRSASEFTRTAQAFETLNIDSIAVRGIWHILASIYHLGVAGVTKVGSGPTSRIQFANPSAARKAAGLLGVSMEDLQAAAFNAGTSSGSSPAKSPTESTELAWESLEGLVIGLYSEAMAATVALINKAICTSAHTIASILLVDTPGFQNPASCGVQTGASLSDLRHNYLQERLQLLFHHMTLVAPRDRYAQELVEIDNEGVPESHPGPLVSLIDKAPQNHVVRTSQRDLREQDRRGLLWLLDEESMYPNSNDETFLERLFSHYGDREHQSLIRKSTGIKQFILQHLQGTNPVLYCAHGWVKHSREHPSIRNAATLLQDSSKDEINRLYVGSLTRSSGGIVFCGSIAGLEGTQSLRRVSSIRRSFTSAGVKRNSIMLHVKFTVDGIIDTLRRTGTHFVHCYLLQHHAGLHSSSSTNGSSNSSFQSNNEEMVNVPLLRSQLRGSQLLEAARLHRFGFPESVPLTEFVRRFGLLAEVASKDITVEQILAANEIDTTSYRIGPSQILFRSGVLSQLEAKRDELLSDRIIQLQAYCRGYLARRRVAQRRVQELAVRCIQRNVKAFLAVRDWPWWRLLVRVTPLLNVHRTEEQLKLAKDELTLMRSKLEKIENDRNVLKTENDKLEAKLSEMTVDLTEERSTSNIASERLEAETAERLKLEKELHEQQTKVKNLQETSEKLEMELICAKSDLNGISEDEDQENEDNIGGVYKLKYERVARELEFTKRRLQTQHEHDLEQLVGLKKQLEKKLSDAYEEVEEQRQVVGQWKRKAQKMTNEMNDLRMLLEEQNSRNNLLEKKQRKFDSELQSLQDGVRQERQAKDRLSREKDVLIAEKFTLDQTLADTRLELELKEEKLASLQRELEEMTFGGGTEEEVAQLRRSKNEMDRRLKEQEEELDEMAGQVQLLEQAKLRLEMTLETMRKEARREAQLRDDELEEARGSAYKKIKALECQLETEHEERTLLLREKHELERRLSAMEDQDRVDRQAEEAANQKLRRDLRKYKALLKDAQSQLDRLKADTPGKTLIRQLRNQLEDAESARLLAMKARQTAEAELSEVQSMFEEAQRARNDAEDKSTAAHRDRAELQAQIEENEEELAELMKKYSATVKQLNTEQIAVSEYEFRISELEAERNNLKDQVGELQTRLENIENMADPSAAVLSKRLELRAKELESRMELEQATRARLEVQVNRHKEALEKIQNEVSQSKMRELTAQDALKKSQKSLRELREEFHVISGREQESIARRKDLEKKLEQAEAESASLRNDLRLALQRIADLQQAMEEGDDDVSESEESESSDGSLSDLEERLRPIQVKRTSLASIKETNGLSGNSGDTALVIREKKSENSPRNTAATSSSSSSSSTPTTTNTKMTGSNGESLKLSDSSYA